MKHFKILILTLIVATSYAQEGIRPWEMRNANGSGYVMISGVDSVMYYDVLNNYIKDTLGYSRIDSIKCVSDTIRLYTNNGQFKMPFSCSGGGGGGGSGTVTSVAVAAGTTGTDVNVTGSPITSSGTITVHIPTASATNRGALSSTDWSTFNSKIGGTGSASRIPYFFNSSTLTGEDQWMYYNGTGNKLVGVGFSGGNSAFPDYLESGSSGFISFDANIAGIGVATSSSNRWAMMNNTSGTLYWNRNSGGTWPTTPYMSLSSTGVFKLSDLAGTNSRLVQANSTGTLSSLANGITGQVLTATASGYAWQTPSSSSTPGLASYVGVNDIASPPSTYLFSNVSGATPVKLLYTQQSGGNISYTTGTGNISIPTTGTYEIIYSHDVSSTSTTGTRLYSGIYVNDVFVSGTGSYNTQPFVTNQSYHHRGSVVRQLNSGQVVQVKVVLHNGTTSHDVTHSGAQLTIKKLN